MIRTCLLVALVLADVTPRGDGFRPETAKLVASLQIGKSRTVSLAFTREARRAVILASDGSLGLWDLTANRELKRAPESYFASRISMSADGSRVLAVSSDRRTLRLIDIERGEEVRSFTDLQAPQMGTFALSPDGRRVATVRADQSVRIADAASGEDLKTLLEPGTPQGGTLAWSPDGRIVAIHGWDSTVRTVDAATGTVVATMDRVGHSPVFLGFSADSQTLAIVTQDGKIRLWDQKGTEIASLEDPLTGARQLAFSRDGRWMAAVDISGKARIWNARTWRRLRDFEAGPTRTLAFSPDGRHLALAAGDGTVKLWGGSGPWVPPSKIEPSRGRAPAFLGISPALEEEEGDESVGVVIGTIIGGTAAEKAGLRVGDVILKIGATETGDFATLRSVVSSLREGDEIDVTYRRDKTETKVKIKLGARPSDPSDE